MSKIIAGLIAVLIILLFSCRPPAPVSLPAKGYVETGLASWYGPEFHGRPTSSREIFNQHDLTAAHRTLPFGTVVQVTNLENGRQVNVRINDRGPFIKDRIIDLSYAAARMLDMIGPGIARVRLEVVGFESVKAQSGDAYFLQVGSFVNPERARALYLKLQSEFPSVFISPFQSGQQTFYRVRLKADSEMEARSLAERLSAAGHPVLILRE